MRIALMTLVALALTCGVAKADRYSQRTVVRGCMTAQQAADEMARTGWFGHRGGCGVREGIGMGSTPEQALANCCYNNGRYSIRERAVARGANGRYYAVIRYAN